MALVCRLLLLLFLLVALHARAARAAPCRARGADEDGGDGYPASELDVGLEPSGHPGDPLVVGGFPTSWPVPVLEPERSPTALPVGEGDPVSRLGSRTEPPAVRVGRPRAKNHAEGGKKSLESLEVLKQALEELEKRHETDQEAGQEQAFPEGSSGLLPPFVKETEAMQGTGMPGNRCPVVSWGHPSGSLCGGRLSPRCPLLRFTSAAKAEGVWGPRCAADGKRDSCTTVPPAVAASQSLPGVPGGLRRKSSTERDPCRQLRSRSGRGLGGTSPSSCIPCR
ncbi:uncharacterized protein LOC129211521 [Grus americana]|uniref:uncharacterized protein LOC129211521 n=1 Tax=Grus americana TaxID=9117 RepID=UPI002407E5C3|nr:uncharacterized protein LOC129211521 [Grus americana]